MAVIEESRTIVQKAHGGIFDIVAGTAVANVFIAAPAVGEIFRPGVTASQREVSFTLRRIDLQSVVVGDGIAQEHVDGGVALICPERIQSRSLLC